jgi:8-oxo-dGTP pyrophosphatase MutT (NUDIX family)
MKIEATQRLLADTGGPLADTNYWAKRGAGCIILARSTGRFLFPLRSQEVSEGGTWGTWGGSIDAGEEPSTTVRRELAEEAGYAGPLELRPLFTFRSADLGISYQNYLAIVDDEFQPVLNWETSASLWTSFGRWPTPQHPGLETLLNDERSMSTIRYYLNAGGK